MVATKEIAGHFLTGELTVQSIDSGHINDTFLVEQKFGTSIVLQKINSKVFTEPKIVIENLEMIGEACEQIIPKSILTLNQETFVIINGDYWRAFQFIPNTETILRIENEDQAYYGANLFGQFIVRCSSLDPSNFKESIDDFHNLSFRIEQFKLSLKNDAAGRKSEIKNIISFLDQYSHLGNEFSKCKSALPIRVTHNDTKSSNLLYDTNKRKAVAVIDLDTVMPGLSITDYGDIIRSFAPGGAEDDPEPDSSEIRIHIAKAIKEGFIESVSGTITKDEIQTLKLGAQFIIFEQAIRFLADYLNGDVYYKTTREKQNLDRAVHHLNILRSLGNISK